MPIRMCVVSIALTVAVGSVHASSGHHLAHDQNTGSQRLQPDQASGTTQASGATPASARMADGRQWTTRNLDVDAVPSSCYADAPSNCRQYGRVYTWESARRGCQALGDGWRLPTDDEWRQLAKHYGGIFDDSSDRGNAAYKALLAGGSSGLNAMLGGGRNADDGQYARLEAHGFYWTASPSDPGRAWFYNFGRGSSALYRQRGGEKQMAISVRCIRD